MNNFEDFLGRRFNIGDWFIQVNGSRAIHLCRVTGFKKSRMHFIRVWEKWVNATGYTTNYKDCTIFPDNDVPLELKLKSEELFIKEERRINR